MSAAPRLAARATLAGQYYWFNFFQKQAESFFVYFLSMYYLQCCIFYNQQNESRPNFDGRCR